MQGTGLGRTLQLGHGSVGNAMSGTRQSRASHRRPPRRERLPEVASQLRPEVGGQLEACGMLRGSDEVPIGRSGKGSYRKDVTFELSLKAWREEADT